MPPPVVVPDMGAVPSGWDVLNSATGEVYYVNTVTGTAQQEFPSASALPDGWDIVHSASTGVHASDPTALVSWLADLGLRVCPGACPCGLCARLSWLAVVLPGEDYYINTRTGQTSFELPTQASAAGAADDDEQPEVHRQVAAAGRGKDAFKLDLDQGVQTGGSVGPSSPSRGKPKLLQQMMKLRQQQQERRERDQSALPPKPAIETVTVSDTVAASMSAAAAARDDAAAAAEEEEEHGRDSYEPEPERGADGVPPCSSIVTTRYSARGGGGGGGGVLHFFLDFFKGV
eukprot:COSAG01_NODE_7071_length_3367_cov_5.939718_1_plen_288_part_00